MATFRLALDSMPLMNALAYLSRESERNHLLITLILWTNKLECSTGATVRLGLNSLPQMNTLAYLSRASVRKMRKFYNAVTFL